MYDSPETKLVKDVFNDPRNFDHFFTNVRQITFSVSMSRKYAEEMYKVLRNEIRFRFKKFVKMTGTELNKYEVREAFSRAMEEAINDYVSELSKISNKNIANN